MPFLLSDGAIMALQPGETLRLCGRWQTDPQHGSQFRHQAVEVLLPSSVDETARYLGSGVIPLIGPVLARRLVAAFDEATLAMLDATPGRVREVPGIGRGRAAALGRLAAVSGPFALPRGNALVTCALHLRADDVSHLDSLPQCRAPWPPCPFRKDAVALLNVQELAGLWHLQAGEADVPLVERTRAQQWLPLPSNVARRDQQARGASCVS